MEEKDYRKIVWIVAFLAFATGSCFLTEESLHMLLPSWHPAMCWIVTVGFFIIASLGTKMIVDSLNMNIYMEKRGWYLSGGIIIVLLFWLVCSMPTNTHSFFYRAVINDMVNNDISTTCGYLNQIENNTKYENEAKDEINALEGAVNQKLMELVNEITNQAYIGFGPEAEKRLQELGILLGYPNIPKLAIRKGATKNDIRKAYYSLISDKLDEKIKKIKDGMKIPDADNLAAAREADTLLKMLQDSIATGSTDLNNSKHMAGNNGVCDKINKGYNAVKVNASEPCFVVFNSEQDSLKYTADIPVTDVKQIISVFNVWENFFQGKYKGYGFAYWILLAILVDVGAFFFFDLAFRRTED